MARCKHCGEDTFPNRFVCPSCLDKTLDCRKEAYAMAEEKLGPLCPENHVAFVKMVKKIEKKLRKEKD